MTGGAIMKILRIFIILSSIVLFATTAKTETIFITGGNSGIGLALTKAYLNKGWCVYATYRNDQRAEGLFAIKDQKLNIISVDFLDKNYLKTIKYSISEVPIDVVIYNAAFFAYKANRYPDLDTQEWLDSFKINTIAPIQITHILQDNLELGKYKKVIAISSRRASNEVNIKDAYDGRYAYRSSKAALNSSMVALAQDLKIKDITVIMLHPGRVATAMTKFDGISPEDSASRIVNFIHDTTILQTGKFFDVTSGNEIPW